MKKSDICSLVVTIAVALPIGFAANECVELIMDKIDERYDDDLKENHKIAHGLIKTGLYCGAAGIGAIASVSLGYSAKGYGTLIFKD